MAKKQTKPNSQGRIRLIFLDVESDSDAILEGIQTLKEAVSQSFQPKQVIQRIEVPNLSDSNDNSEDGFLPFEDEEQIEADIVEARPKSEKKTTSRSFPKMELMGELDLHPKTQESFEDFYEKHTCKTQQDRIIVSLYYLCRILKIDGVTPNHIFTCLKNVNAKTPNNLPQEIRNVGKRKGWLEAGDSKNINILNAGENYVEHNLAS